MTTETHTQPESRPVSPSVGRDADVMTPNETFVLLLALKADGPLRYQSVYRAVRGERAWSILNGLHKAGALSHPAYNHWEITENGRIAAALAMAKDSKLADAFEFLEVA